MKDQEMEKLRASFERLHGDYQYLDSEYQKLKSKYEGLEDYDTLAERALRTEIKLWRAQLENEWRKERDNG